MQPAKEAAKEGWGGGFIYLVEKLNETAVHCMFHSRWLSVNQHLHSGKVLHC